MLCADTNCWIAFFAGEDANDVRALTLAIQERAILMAPVVLAELLSFPALPPAAERTLLDVPQRPVPGDHWQRAGKLRAELRMKGLQPKLMDTLIAQYCLDHELILMSRGKGFLPFAKHTQLALWGF